MAEEEMKNEGAVEEGQENPVTTDTGTEVEKEEDAPEADKDASGPEETETV